MINVFDITEFGAVGDGVTELEKKAVEQIEGLYGVKFVDPLSLETIIKQLESEIEEFESNVDYALSESNSQTFIEIPD